MKHFKVSVVIPAFNEQDNLPELAKELTKVLSAYPDYEVIFIDDGSSDNTLNVIKALHAKDSRINYLSFSRNFGHQYALKAGLDHASGDCVISMDADMQHPPHLIPQLIENWQNGNDVVYTVRQESCHQSWLKRKTSNLFYKVLRFVTGLNTPQGAADFRLLDRHVVEALKSAPEKVLFLRGFITWLGFKQCGIEYQPAPRFAGTSHYTLRKMVGLALTGITSFSIQPLRLATWLGLIVSSMGVFYAIYALANKYFGGSVITGWTSLMIVILILGGTQLFMMGIFGEYLGTIFIESKRRPSYLLRENSLIKQDETPTIKKRVKSSQEGSVSTSAAAWLLLGAVAVYILIALLTQTEWLFGDDYLFMVAINNGAHSPLILEAGRFYPLGFADFNLLWLLPNSDTIFTHDLVTAVVLMLTLFATAKVYAAANQAAGKQPVFDLYGVAMVGVLIMTPAFTQIFLNIVYPEKMVILFGSLFIWFYLRAFNSQKTSDYVWAAICAVIATYCKEPVFGMFVIIAATLLIFHFRGLNYTQKWFNYALLFNGFIFLIIYFAITSSQSGTLYFEGKNNGNYFELAINMLGRNKIIIVLWAAALWRFVAALRKPQPLTNLVADSLIYASVGYFLAYVALKLQDNYYLTPLYVFGLPGLFYYLRQPNYHRTFRWSGWLVLMIISLTTFPTPRFLVKVTHDTRAEHGLLLRQMSLASTDGRSVYWLFPNSDVSYPLHRQLQIVDVMNQFISNNQAKDFRTVREVPAAIVPGSLLVVSDFLNTDPYTQGLINQATHEGKIRLRYHIWNLRLFEFR